MGEVHDIRVKCPYEILNVEDIKIECKPDEHGYLYLKCLIDDSIQFNSTINANTDDKIYVYEGTEDNVLFNGIVKNIKTNHFNGNYYLEIEGITFSSTLDVKLKSRSFQNANMTYEELLETILKDYKRALFTLGIDKSEKIGKPIFQYKETDWEFLKRLSSELNTEIYCDIIKENNIIYFGRPDAKSYEIEDNTYYRAGKNLKRFYEAGGYEAGFHDTDYFYYEIMRKERYILGDEIEFKNKKLYVSEYEGVSDRGELIYKYRLCRKNGVWMTKKFNSLISGASLEGKVLAVDGEKVKLHLDIDEKQSKDEASWFTYAPPTGNMMYSMPLVGTTASLYFADETQVNPTIVNCIRKNGSGCAKTSDTSKRYFGTEHGSEIEMTPEAINIKGGSKEPLSISFDDNIGVTITSPKKLTLTADEEIIFKTPKNINVKAQSQILFAKTNTKSGVSIETDFQFLSNNVIQDGRDREAFAPFDDAPKKPDPPKKKGFNWGALAIVAVAVVVAVAVTVATAGMAGPVAVAVTGAVVGACIGVGSVALGDVISGDHSSLKDYLIAGFVGAVSGAIFSPFQAIKSLGGMLKLGAATGAFESGITQLLESGGINPLRLIQDTALGIATAGIFHGAGKVITKCSPFVKKAFTKVISNAKSGILSLADGMDNMLNSLRLGEVVEMAGFGKMRLDAEPKETVRNFMSKIIGEGDDVTKGVSNPVKSYSGDLMSPEEAARYSEYWRKKGIGSDNTWKAFSEANPGKTIDDYFELVNDMSPWPIGKSGTPKLLQSGDRFYMAVENSAPDNMIGGFGVKEKITSTQFIRENLAVKSDWKSSCNVIREFEVNDGVSLNVLEGHVGPQIDLPIDSYLPGDMTITQYDLFSGLGRGINREDYVHIVDEFWVD